MLFLNFFAKKLAQSQISFYLCGVEFTNSFITETNINYKL